MNTRVSTVAPPFGWLSLIVLSAVILFLPLRAHAGWQQSFTDEFNGTSVDASKWQMMDGFNARFYDGEKECYQDGNSTVSGGNLVLQARKEGNVCGQPYSSGRVTTWNKQMFFLGYFEARMKIPAGSGMWPAFWLAWYPGIKYWQEIDIMEWVGSDPHNMFTTYHWSQDGIVNHQGSGTATYGPDWTSGWHTFGVDWQLDKIVWYLDGKAVKTLVQGQNGARLPTQPLPIILNLALGGSWAGPVDESKLSTPMLVDYVRTWKRVNDGTPDAVPPTLTPPSVARLAPSLMMSAASDRSAAVALQGAAPTDDIYVFAKTDSTASRVEFWLDEATPAKPAGTPDQTESAAPFDFAGTAADTSAQPLDISTLSSGQHTVSARVTLQDGTVQPIVTASFTVNATNLYVSSASDRSNPRLLQGYSTPSNTNLYVFAGPETDIARVVFWLDDPNPSNPSGAPVKTENLPPFDLAGTGRDGSALAFNTSAVAKGVHQLTMMVTKTDGTVSRPVTVRFNRW